MHSTHATLAGAAGNGRLQALYKYTVLLSVIMHTPGRGVPASLPPGVPYRTARRIRCRVTYESTSGYSAMFQPVTTRMTSTSGTIKRYCPPYPKAAHAAVFRGASPVSNHQ